MANEQCFWTLLRPDPVPASTPTNLRQSFACFTMPSTRTNAYNIYNNIYYTHIEQTNTRSIIYYIFLKPSFCHRDVCAQGVNVYMCVFVIWFSCTTISFRTVHVTWIFIVHSAFNGHRHYSRNIVFPGSSYMIPHTPYYYNMHPYISNIRLVKVLRLFKYVCILMKSNNKVGTYNIIYLYNIWDENAENKANLWLLHMYTSTHHQRNPKYRSRYIKQDEKYGLRNVRYTYVISLSIHIWKYTFFE